MPVETREADNGLGLIIIGSGDVTEAEYLDFYTRQLTQGMLGSRIYRYTINDYTAVTSIAISASAVEEIAMHSKKAAEMDPDRVTAIVANKDIIFGLARMWELMSGDVQTGVMVFRDRNDAEEWIRQEVKDRFQIDILTFR